MSTYSAIFSCAPQYFLAALSFCSNYQIHLYVHLCAKFTKKHWDYLRPLIEAQPYIKSVHTVRWLADIKWRQPKWDQTVLQYSNFVDQHIIDGTHLQDPRWLNLHRLGLYPCEYLYKFYRKQYRPGTFILAPEVKNDYQVYCYDPKKPDTVQDFKEVLQKPLVLSGIDALGDAALMRGAQFVVSNRNLQSALAYGCGANLLQFHQKGFLLQGQYFYGLSSLKELMDTDNECDESSPKSL